MFSYSKHKASCHSRQHHHGSSQRINDDHSSFQTTVHITAAIRSVDYSPLPLPPPEYVSSHHWHRHRHRASNERMAMERVQDWLETSHNIDDTLATPPGEPHQQLDDDMLVLHEHCCRRYYLHRQY